MVVPDELRSSRTELRSRVREAYVASLAMKLRAIVEACVRWQVQLLVFPEYSIPLELLEDVAAWAADADGMLVVAGTHSVDGRSLRSGAYQRLGWTGDELPERGMAVAPVLCGGRLLGLVGKLDKE